MVKMNKNFKQRLEFVEYWANYVKTHPNKVWSKQQNVIINSILQSANQNPKTYLKIKEIMKNANNNTKQKRI